MVSSTAFHLFRNTLREVPQWSAVQPSTCLGTRYEKYHSGQQYSPPLESTRLTVKNLHSSYRLTRGFSQGIFTGQGEAVSNHHQMWLYDNYTALISCTFINPLNPELNPICYLLALLGAHHFLHVSRIRVKSLTISLLMSYIYMEHPFLMFLDHTQRRSTVGRTPLDE